MRALLDWLSQRMYPPELRIPAPVWPEDLRGLLQQVAQGLAQPAAAPARLAKEEQYLLADCATRLWRLRRRITDPQGRPLSEYQGAWSYVDKLWTAMEQGGVKIIDHTGEIWHDGLAINMLSAEPRPDLRRETIIETVRPTVYYRDIHLQMGQVIVGLPAPASTTGAGPALPEQTG